MLLVVLVEEVWVEMGGRLFAPRKEHEPLELELDNFFEMTLDEEQVLIGTNPT